MKTRFYVMDGDRKCCQYADKQQAEKHARSIKGTVAELPFTPQWRWLGNWRKTYGVRHADCSINQARRDGVEWFEVRKKPAKQAQ